MAFQLKKGTSTFDFDLDGTVKKGGVDHGTWATTKDAFCRLAVTKPDGTQYLHDVVWRFEGNQLCLFDGTQQIYNFQTSNTPKFNVSDKAVLQVFPRAGKDFSFELRGEWDLTGNFDLAFSVNGTVSVIDGYIENDASIFEYWFADENEMYRIIFTGKWDGNPISESKGTGDVMMHYLFQREDGSADEFSLPTRATFDKSFNQFVYEFEKSDGETKCSLKFAGLINVGKDSRITYSISAQKKDGKEKILSSEIKINAVMVTKKVEGAVELNYAFMKKDGKPSENVLSIGGSFKFDKASLQILFAYSSNGKSRNIFFGGKLTLNSTGTSVEWAFKKENNVSTLSIKIANVKFGDKVTGNSELVVTSAGGKAKSIKFLMGVSFKI